MGLNRSGLFFLQVNPILCDGYGHCHELAPELVALDEWGYPIIDATPRPLSDDNAHQAAIYAERGCPRQALRIRKVQA